MNTTVKSLQDLYVKLGGSLTDTYSDIDSGAAVGDYTLIPDMIQAVTKAATPNFFVVKATLTTPGNPSEGMTLEASTNDLKPIVQAKIPVLIAYSSANAVGTGTNNGTIVLEAADIDESIETASFSATILGTALNAGVFGAEAFDEPITLA